MYAENKRRNFVCSIRNQGSVAFDLKMKVSIRIFGNASTFRFFDAWKCSSSKKECSKQGAEFTLAALSRS